MSQTCQKRAMTGAALIWVAPNGLMTQGIPHDCASKTKTKVVMHKIPQTLIMHGSELVFREPDHV